MARQIPEERRGFAPDIQIGYNLSNRDKRYNKPNVSKIYIYSNRLMLLMILLIAIMTARTLNTFYGDGS